MTKYVAFLRAINVGGRFVKMEKLREYFSELGLTNVASYIQSGNVFFESSEKDRNKLKGILEKHLEKKLGYKVPVMLRTVDELEKIVKLDPFGLVQANPNTRFCIFFISNPLPKELEFPYKSEKDDFEILSSTAGEAFIVIKLVKGKFTNIGASVEKLFGLDGTMRFYHTTIKILEAAKK